MNNNIYKLILQISIVLVTLIIVNLILIKFIYGDVQTAMNDFKYSILIRTSNINTENLDKHKLFTPKEKKNTFLIITYDSRKNEPYIIQHNKNIQSYANKYNYTYQYISDCSHNVYWAKLFLVNDALVNTKYDYVVWLDSDTIIINQNIELNTFVNSYDSELFFVDDNIYPKEVINAGVFIIKNSINGRKYISDCLGYYSPNFINKYTNKLRGNWAGYCYEQGVMNIVAHKINDNNKDKNNSKKINFTLVRKKICLCSPVTTNIKNDQFIFHYYGSSSIRRNKIFTNYNNDLKI